MEGCINTELSSSREERVERVVVKIEKLSLRSFDNKEGSHAARQQDCYSTIATTTNNREVLKMKNKKEIEVKEGTSGQNSPLDPPTVVANLTENQIRPNALASPIESRSSGQDYSNNDLAPVLPRGVKHGMRVSKEFSIPLPS